MLSVRAAATRASTVARKSAAYAHKNLRYFTKEPAFFFMKSLARFELARRWATRPRGRETLIAPAVPTSVVHVPNGIERVHATLRDEGYCIGLELDPSVMAALHDCARTSLCYGDRDRHLPLHIDDRGVVEQRLGRPLRLASYFKQQEDWPAFQALRTDPQVLSIARTYLGCEPVYIRSEIAWSFACPATRAQRLASAQVLHCDINDFKTLKFFFYLTDVGPKNGPHAYIKKGPRRRTALHQLLGQRCAAIPDEDLLATYGPEQLVTVLGPAGTGFVGDPYYFHRGSTPEEGARLLLQLEFARRSYDTWYFDVG